MTELDWKTILGLQLFTDTGVLGTPGWALLIHLQRWRSGSSLPLKQHLSSEMSWGCWIRATWLRWATFPSAFLTAAFLDFSPVPLALLIGMHVANFLPLWRELLLEKWREGVTCLQVEIWWAPALPSHWGFWGVDGLLVQLPSPISLPKEQNIDNNPLSKERKEPYYCRNDSSVVGVEGVLTRNFQFF